MMGQGDAWEALSCPCFLLSGQYRKKITSVKIYNAKKLHKKERRGIMQMWNAKM